MEFNLKQSDEGLVFCEANGAFTLEEMQANQRRLSAFIEENGNQQSVVILDLRTTIMPLDQIIPSIWEAIHNLEHPAILGYVVIGKSIYLSIYGNAFMRLFRRKVLYARTRQQAEAFARQFLAEKTAYH